VHRHRHRLVLRRQPRCSVHSAAGHSADADAATEAEAEDEVLMVSGLYREFGWAGHHRPQRRLHELDLGPAAYPVVIKVEELAVQNTGDGGCDGGLAALEEAFRRAASGAAVAGAAVSNAVATGGATAGAAPKAPRSFLAASRNGRAVLGTVLETGLPTGRSGGFVGHEEFATGELAHVGWAALQQRFTAPSAIGPAASTTEQDGSGYQGQQVERNRPAARPTTSLALPPDRAFLNAACAAAVRELYAGDFKAYGYDREIP